MQLYDAEIKIELNITDLNSPYTLVQVYVPYMDKTIEVKVPHNIQVGHKIRIRGMGYSDSQNHRGDLYVTVDKINREREKKVRQEMVVVEFNDFSEVNIRLNDGWIVKEFKPFRDGGMVYVYVLLEKTNR